MTIPRKGTPGTMSQEDTSETIFRAYLGEHSGSVAPLRYHVRLGASVELSCGFANKETAERFIRESSRHFGLDWRAGWVWRVRGLAMDLSIVDRHLMRPKTPARNLD
jgi:hypothetical protein